MKQKLLIAAAALATMLPFTASAAVRYGGGVVVRPYVYGGFYRPYWGPYWGSYWGPGYWGPGYYESAPNYGTLKFDTKLKDAQVFVDNSYAGTMHDNKTMHLRPGRYNVEVRLGGQTLLSERVYVVAGKTLHLQPANY